MSYVANTDAERAEMLSAIGIESPSSLFRDIPKKARVSKLDLPAPLSEPELVLHMRKLAERNTELSHQACFLGAGAYRHFIPSVVGQIIGRSEFYTCYTPYQPEVSQGTLQSIYEYQSLVCLLTGMDVANASIYDGATALAEAAIMSVAATGRDRIVIAPTVNPEYRLVARSYTQGLKAEVLTPSFNPVRPSSEGAFNLTEAAHLMDDRTACLVDQQPNFLGCLEDLAALAAITHDAGALLVVCIDPISLGLLKSPGELGADVVVGEGQPLGMTLSYGGPYLGLFACRQQFIRSMPGRIAGATVDSRGKQGFVLTFQTREQHIRREKATSNICSNEALCALASAVYLTWMGKEGLRKVADLCLQKAHYAASRIAELPGYGLPFQTPFFREFVVSCPISPDEVNRLLLDEGIIGGYELGRIYPELADCLLFCVTELNTREEIDRLVSALARIGGTTAGEGTEVDHA